MSQCAPKLHKRCPNPTMLTLNSILGDSSVILSTHTFFSCALWELRDRSKGLHNLFKGREGVFSEKSGKCAFLSVLSWHHTGYKWQKHKMVQSSIVDNFYSWGGLQLKPFFLFFFVVHYAQMCDSTQKVSHIFSFSVSDSPICYQGELFV